MSQQKEDQLKKRNAALEKELLAKNRELDIETALEKVRARTMAMQHSDELTETSFLLDSQVRGLGIKTWGCAFNIYGKTESTEWFGNEAGVLPTYTVPRKGIFKKYYDYGQKGEKFIVEEFKGKACIDHYEFMSTLPVIGDILKQLKVANGSFPIYQMDHVVYYKYGYLLFITLEHAPEAYDIFKRFTKVFEQTYTRFLDLQKAEAQAREAQIENALEKVRSRTMAMQQSEELPEAANNLFLQVQALGIPAWSAGYCIWDEDKKNATANMSSEGVIQKPFILPNVGVGYNFQKPLEKGESFHVGELGGKTIVKHYEFMRTLPIFGEVIDGIIEAGFPLPTFQIFHIVYFEHGYVMFITYERVPLAHDIFKRFGKVFKQTYTRFLDLQKAEAQAREAQIETALERVRSRSMAMHKSDELLEVINVVSVQLQHLGMKFSNASFGINTGSFDFDFWVSAPGIDHPFRIHLPYLDSPIFNRLKDAQINEQSFFADSFNAIETKEWMQHLFTNNKIAEFTPQTREYLLSKTGFVRSSVLLRNIILSIINYEGIQYSNDENDVIIRFANAFEQAYTRFLDLQKAEAQAREALIEAALERIRSKSMAMHKSEELLDVIEVVAEQLIQLNLKFDTVSFGKNNQQGDFKFWLSAKGQPKPMLIQVPFLNTRVLNTVKKAQKKGINFIADVFTAEENRKWSQHMINFSELKHFPQIVKEFILNAPGFARSSFLLKNIDLYVGNYRAVPFTDEDNAIFSRFAQVFEQAYTRFLDLQKAEEQAKEAQIETALERVRSRTMAMQTSDELAETAVVVFKQLITLGIAPNRLYIGIINADNGAIEFWTTDEDGTKISNKFIGNKNGNKSVRKMYDGWSAQQKSLTIDMQGKELSDYLDYLGKELHVPFKKGHLQKRRVQTMSFFSKGFIGMASPDEQPEETTKLLERFAAVFNLTYTRFNDLKIAEAHAIQARKDLILLQTEKKKAEEALTELKATQSQLIQSEKMASLGELTAGIAHEIQNPLNFVNNFSEVSKELLDEMKVEMELGNMEDVKEIMQDVIQNLEKINHHGKRADAIVKGMLQHSRTSSGIKEPTNINALADEYLRLAYHGLRAKDKSFNATMKTDYDASIGTVNVIAQDMGRVILNLITNAFYVVDEKNKSGIENYKPTVSVSTLKKKDIVEIRVTDNGNGIPQKDLDKIFQPFFTTKPSGQGTGLGLSLSYDIVKAHGGELKVETKEGDGTTFIIQLPTLV